MKQEMDKNNVNAFVSYRIQRAKETLREADLLVL